MPNALAQTLTEIEEILRNLIDISQVITLVMAWLAAWILQFPLRRILKTIESMLPQNQLRLTLMAVLRQVAFPFTLLALINLGVELLGRMEQPVEFVQLISRAVTVWLFYRLLTALVDTNLTSEKARFWSRRVLLPLALIIGVLSALGLLQPILQWGIYIESIGWRLTVGSVLVAIGIIVGFYFIARWLSSALAQSFLAEAGIDPSLVDTLSKVTSYLVITAGVLVAMASVGINLSTLTVVLGGLSVGLAFGLQEIVNNFVSGFILLIERSIVPGDVVDVDNHVGEVQKVGVRSTVIRTRDNIDLIIPNSKFLTEVVTNMTYAENLIRIRVSVGVSYSANPRQVEQVLLDVARQNPNILKTPVPSVQFKEFGDSSLNFELLVWIAKAIETPVLTSDLRFGIWDALAAHNIEIPFPQRDIHIRSGVPWSDLAQSKDNPQQAAKS